MKAENVAPVNESAKSELITALKEVRDFEMDKDEKGFAILKDDVKSVLGPRPSLALLESILKDYEKEYRLLLEDRIPMILAEYGLKKVVIGDEGGEFDGVTVSPETVYNTKTVDKAAMIAWLEEIGAGDIVKDTLALGKGGYTPELEAFLKEKGYTYSVEEKVEGASLKKVIADRAKEGESMPPTDAVEVKVFTQAKIAYPKLAI